MVNKKTILAIILARKSSKRLPNKNIKKFAGKPLIYWTIKAAKESKYIDRIIVSTDSNKIATISRKFGGEVPFKRPKKVSQNNTTSEEAQLHTLNWIKKNEKKQYDYFIYLQPTSPLRNAIHIDEAFEKIIKNKSAQALVSVKRFNKNPLWLKTVNNDEYLKNYIKKDKNIKSGTNVYLPNGAIYILKTKEFLVHKSNYPSKTTYFIMDEDVSVDIDNEFDFELAEYFYNLKYKK